MAYYKISEQVLRQLISEHSRSPTGETWFDGANLLADENARAGTLVQKKPIWSKIKAVYSAIQRDKCAYCELGLGGSATQHLEHFRPKAKVTKWPRTKKHKFDFPVGSGRGTGYHWLTYDPLNYAVACAHCNSSLKGNAFPIAGTGATNVADVRALNAAERPLLLQPFGDWGDDPEQFIEFDEVLACAKPGLSDPDRQRAVVTIAFFRLNDPKLPLLNSRRLVARFMFRSLDDRRTAANAAERADAQDEIDVFKSRGAPQSLFARWFERIYENNQLAAKAIRDAAIVHLKTIDKSSDR